MTEFFDVKFCPFQPLDYDPIFAAVSSPLQTFRNLDRHNPCEVIRIIRDNDDAASGCCCTWTRNPVDGSPYICVGGVDAKVKIYDVSAGSLVECLVGHGGDVNDLATSPVDSSIIASASDDTSVRIWSIDPIHKEQPCLCILAGEGHSWNLLTLAFHDSGRYLLSGGHDQVINLVRISPYTSFGTYSIDFFAKWTIPSLQNEHVITPLQVHYPHFSTSAIHSGIVDCVAFYGDQILSRACHDNVIVLWRIEGFSSDGPPPPQSAAPAPKFVFPTSNEDPDRLTWSAFVPVTSPTCPAQYTRLAEFYTPQCGPQFFMRFKLHHVPGQNPVLAFCNAAGNILFWDLKRLTEYRHILAIVRDPYRDKNRNVQLPDWLRPVAPRQKSDVMGRFRALGMDREAGASGEVNWADLSPETLESWASKYNTEDAQEPLRPHKIEVQSTNFVGRQVAWSPSGQWCVVVGSSNSTIVLQRWVGQDSLSVSASPGN